MGTRLTDTKSRLRRAIAIGAGLLATVSLVIVAVDASAASKPTLAQVQAKVNQLTTQFNKVSEQLDQAGERLTAAQRQLKQVSARWRTANAQFEAAQAVVAQIAAVAYENGGATSIAGVLSSDDPSAVLRQGSLLLQMSTSHDAQTRALLADASQLQGAEQEMRRTESGIVSLKNELSSRKSSLKKLIATEQATLDSLTTPQQQQVSNGTIGAGGSGGSGNTTTKQPYTGPTGSQADTAVAFAYAQLGCAYVYGGTGPCGDGFDCSGLVQAAWKAAGISIPRDTWEQWAALPHISSSSLEPGDLMYYNGESHVAMYVGGGMIIDAPVPGQVVEKIPQNSSWYAATYDGAVRP